MTSHPGSKKHACTSTSRKNRSHQCNQIFTKAENQVVQSSITLSWIEGGKELNNACKSVAYRKRNDGNIIAANQSLETDFAAPHSPAHLWTLSCCTVMARKETIPRVRINSRLGEHHTGRRTQQTIGWRFLQFGLQWPGLRRPRCTSKWKEGWKRVLCRTRVVLCLRVRLRAARFRSAHV